MGNLECCGSEKETEYDMNVVVEESELQSSKDLAEKKQQRKINHSTTINSQVP